MQFRRFITGRRQKMSATVTGIIFSNYSISIREAKRKPVSKLKFKAGTKLSLLK